MIDKVIIKANDETKIHIDDVTYDLDNVIVAIEKQMPKKPKYKSKDSLPMCGECGGIINILQGDANYCPNCGQAIDWSE